ALGPQLDACLAVAAPRPTCVSEFGEAIGGGVVRLGDQALRLAFPNTRDELPTVDPTLPLAGPVAIAVSDAAGSLPCGLRTSTCAETSNVAACIDRLFAHNGLCRGDPDETFSRFTALPPQNDYQTFCTDPVPPCLGTVDTVRFTADAAGNLLIPMDWRGVLVRRHAVPVPRLLRATSAVGSVSRAWVPDPATEREPARVLHPRGHPRAPNLRSAKRYHCRDDRHTLRLDRCAGDDLACRSPRPGRAGVQERQRRRVTMYGHRP